MAWANHRPVGPVSSKEHDLPGLMDAILDFMPAERLYRCSAMTGQSLYYMQQGTGRTTIERYEVEGPVALLLTTTASDVDAELLNRCLVVSVDEQWQQPREQFGWGATQLRHHLQQLCSWEYVIAQGGGRGKLVEYQLLGGEHQPGPICGLLEPSDSAKIEP